MCDVLDRFSFDARGQPAEVELYRGLGTGAFATQGTVPTGSGWPEDLALGDVTGDGAPDLVLATRSAASSWITVLPGTGGFAFAPGVEHEAQWVGTVALADVDGDGVLEAVGAGGTSLEYLPTAAALTSTPTLRTHAGNFAAALAVLDLDRDGDADVAVAALTEDGHVGELYEVTGPRSMAFTEVVDEISKASGRDVRFVSIPHGAFMDGLAEAGIPADYAWLLDYLFSTILDGRNSAVTDGVERALGRPATDFSEYARKVWGRVAVG